MDHQLPDSKKSGYSLKPFFEQTRDLLCIAGFDGYFKKINPALCTLLEYSEDELLSRPINSFIHPEDQNLTAKYRHKILEGKPLLNFENRYIKNSGDVIWFSWTSIPKRDQELVYAIAKDITHQKVHNQHRNELLSNLTRENGHLKKLNYTTSHDLRTPISGLLGVFELIELDNIKDPQTRSLIELLEISTADLKKTLDVYIDGFQQNKSLIAELEEVHIPTYLNVVQKSIKKLLDDADTVVQTDFSGFETILFNPDFMKSILLNLLSNSIKYAHPDRNPVINVKTLLENGLKQLIFSDNGIGFDSSRNKGKIFGLYQTFHDKYDSKGIGLYLVHSHVTELGGSIAAESTVDEGTTFTITFKP